MGLALLSLWMLARVRCCSQGLLTLVRARARCLGLLCGALLRGAGTCFVEELGPKRKGQKGTEAKESIKNQAQEESIKNQA